MRLFLAGASGVIGRSLIPLLRDAGHSVTGMTRTAEGRTRLEALGARAEIVDVFDAGALEGAVRRASPDVVIHQLTDLSDLSASLDPAAQDAVRKRNARLRREGTANLAQAARLAGARRLVAQSIAWAYAPKDTPHREDDPLDLTATGARAISIGEGIVPLEDMVLQDSAFEGIVLRYGELYGPGTWSTEPNGTAPVHVEAAAYAAFLAADRGRPGAYNIAEPGGAVSSDKAITELGWRPDFRLSESH